MAPLVHRSSVAINSVKVNDAIKRQLEAADANHDGRISDDEISADTLSQLANVAADDKDDATARALKNLSRDLFEPQRKMNKR